MDHQVVNVNEISRISQGVRISGEFSSPTDIRIDGEVEGKIYSRSRIVVGNIAAIKGTVLCSDLDLWGKAEGDIYVRGTLTLKSEASIKGNIYVKSLQAELGAQVNGTCRMITETEFDEAVKKMVTLTLDSVKESSHKGKADAAPVKVNA